jgi:hypothetical protein
MEYMVKNSLLFITGLLFLSSCEDLDLKGMLFRTSDSVEKRTEQSLQWNEENGYETIIFPSENTYRICIAGDSHVGTTNNLEKMLLVASDASTYAASVIVGDVTTGHQKDYETLVDFLNRPEFGKVKLLSGNHDTYFNGWEWFQNYFHTSVYYFIVATNSASDLHICLDSSSGTLGSKQLDWLGKTFKDKRDAYRHCFVYSHTNMFRTDDSQTPTGNMPLEETYRLMNLFATYRVNAVFMGHDHVREEIQLNKVNYITLDAITDKHQSPSYLILTCSESFSYTFIDL